MVKRPLPSYSFCRFTKISTSNRFSILSDISDQDEGDCDMPHTGMAETTKGPSMIDFDDNKTNPKKGGGQGQASGEHKGKEGEAPHPNTQKISSTQTNPTPDQDHTLNRNVAFEKKPHQSRSHPNSPNSMLIKYPNLKSWLTIPTNAWFLYRRIPPPPGASSPRQQRL